MTRAFILATVALAFVALAISRVMETSSAQAPPAPGGKGPVVVELFTSEGCSSCPPADELLRELEAQGKIEGVKVIPVGWHVDYWNRLGWKDPFSSAEYSRRQQEYAAALGTDQIYTPQAVVDGTEEFVGSDRRKARTAILKAAKLPKASISIQVTTTAPDSFSVNVQVDRLPPGVHSAEIGLVLLENQLVSDVRAGENSGKRLQHAAVARAWYTQSYASSGSRGEEVFTVKVLPGWQAARMKAAVLLRNTDSWEIVGAAETPLVASPSH